MKHMLQQVFHSPKFVVGFIIFMSILLLSVIYPIFVTGDPLVIIGKGTFFEPGIYVNVVDGIDSQLYSSPSMNSSIIAFLQNDSFIA